MASRIKEDIQIRVCKEHRTGTCVGKWYNITGTKVIGYLYWCPRCGAFGRKPLALNKTRWRLASQELARRVKR